MDPFRLLPDYKTRPWGVDSLEPWFPFTANEPIGEVWFTSNDNVIAGTSTTLGALVARHRDELVGRAGRGDVFPLLLKFLFTADRLSVQVHPDDEYAERHHQSLGKTEAWYVLKHDDQSLVGLGFREPLARARAVDAARSGEIEALLDWKPTRTGDTWLVPAGTVHAIGAGLTIVEVQEHSDITYRLYDYGRPRELHLEHGFTVAELGPYERRTHDAVLGEGRVELTACPYFRLERWRHRRRIAFAGGEPAYHLVIVTHGGGHLGVEPIAPGQVWIVPASSPDFVIELEPDSELLLAYPGEIPSSSFS